MAKNGADKAKTWRLINEITKRKKKKGAAIKFLVDKEGNRIEKNFEIADCLNKHFSSVGKRMAEKLESSIEEEIKDPLDFLAHMNVRTSAFFTKTTDSEILDILKNLNPKKSTGFDLISNRILKETSYIISPFLNMSIRYSNVLLI